MGGKRSEEVKTGKEYAAKACSALIKKKSQFMTIQLLFQVLKYVSLHLHEVLALLGELKCTYVRP